MYRTKLLHQFCMTEAYGFLYITYGAKRELDKNT